ncbi:MAG: hypothetical protein M3008_00105 [Chloroflexota bacterium]|nr:hypothetical protein [Chloroflexota bacterium]
MTSTTERGLTSRVGPVEVSWPRAVGYYGGLALAVGFGMIEPPFGVFIAAVPFFKMLNRPKSSRPVRLFSQVIDGASQPVGGDGDHAIRLVTPDRPSATATGIGAEARAIANKIGTSRHGAAVAPGTRHIEAKASAS